MKTEQVQEMSEKEQNGHIGTEYWVHRDVSLPEYGRVLVFSPDYPRGNIMRFRIMDAEFVRISTEAEYWLFLDSITPKKYGA